MRSRNYCAISSLVLISACLAGDPKADARTVEVQTADPKEDLKEDRKSEHKEDSKEDSKEDEKKEDFKEDSGYGLGLPFDLLPDPEPPCPVGEGRMKDGDCAPEEEFFGEQEALDAEALAQLQAADDAKSKAQAQGQFIKQQIRQTEQAEKDLDEIIQDLKKKKSKNGKLDDPFGEGGGKFDEP